LTNSPFISGDSIANLADRKFMDLNEIRRAKQGSIQKLKSVFVASHLLDEFLEFHGRYLKAKTLITGNSDRNFDVEFNLPPSIRLWLCQNSSINNNNIIRTLPIGIENKKLGRAGLEKYFLQNNTRILDKVFVPPMSPTNVIRRPTILECLNREEIFDVQLQMLNEFDYFRLVSQYRFVLCLEGNGYENHRIWETLYNGGIPILLDSKWSRTLQYLNLPILLVKNTRSIDRKLLLKKSIQFRNFNPRLTEVLWTPFWKRVINSGEIPQV
jgi:hypothetical protein